MLRTAVFLAGLLAALTTGGPWAARVLASPPEGEPPWVEQQVAEVNPGQAYRLDACLTVTAPGLQTVSLRIAWYGEPNGYGASLFQEDMPADVWLVGSEQCLSLTAAEAPCAARSARFGVIAVPDTTAVSVSQLSFAADADAAAVPCPTPPPPTPTPTPSSGAAPSPTPAPTRAPTPTPTPVAEPSVFPSLVNGGFEQVRSDGTPYGWRKVGGEMASASAFHASGRRSAALTSRTASTKWLYQAVAAEGGTFYRVRARVLSDGQGVEAAFLRVSWYASTDGSGTQISTVDSEPQAGSGEGFEALDTGAVQAPEGTRSARVRLMSRPASSAPATVYFDDVSFEETEAAPGEGEDAASASKPTEGVAEAARRDPPAAAPPGAGAQDRPFTLVNSRAPERAETLPAGRGGALWPLLLAIGVPALGLAVVGAHAWAGRLAGGNRRHL